MGVNSHASGDSVWYESSGCALLPFSQSEAKGGADNWYSGVEEAGRIGGKRDSIWSLQTRLC